MTSAGQAAGRFEIWGVPGLPEVRPGDDLTGLLVQALRDDSSAGTTPALADGDIVVVTSKIVSKAEGRIRAGTDRESAIDDEAVRTVSEWTTPNGRTRVVETRHGFVMAAAGVDASNVEAGTVVLLPEDPDASARRLRDGLRERLGVRVGVILTDTAGRVWRNGVVDMAIGAAGVTVIDDLRGRTDPYGNDLGVTMVAVADELAAATELVRTKLSGVPVAVVRGLAHLLLSDGAATADRGASALVRPSAEDRFRLGTPEAMRETVLARRDVDAFAAKPVDPSIVRRAVAAALTAPVSRAAGTAGTAPAARFVLVESDAARKAFVSAADGERGWAAVLDGAPLVVVPCLARPGGERELLAAGAAVENFLVTLAADGLGAAWWFPETALADAARASLGLPEAWTPLGAIGVGYPESAGADRFEPLPDEFFITR